MRNVILFLLAMAVGVALFCAGITAVDWVGCRVTASMEDTQSCDWAGIH